MKSGPPRPQELTDAFVEALCEFRPAKATYFPDNRLAGFFIYVGPRSATWVYRERKSVKGARRMVFEKLGEWPKVDTLEARKRCAIAMGLTAQAIDKPTEREPVTFETAFADYLAYLTRKAEKKGKPPRWAYNVRKLGDSIILPKWAKWSLAEMAVNPAAVAEWHRKVSKDRGPVTANHCARVIRATYKRAARLDVSLPQRLPTSAVEYNDEEPSQDALDFVAFPAWLKAWRRIKSGIHQAYHLTALLVGPRPGELARLRWSDVKDKEKNLILTKAKAGADIVIPMSDEIATAIRMAKDDAEQLGYEVTPDALVFPGCTRRDYLNDLPVRGNALRHTYSTVAADLGIDDLIRHFLMGHAPQGISQRYIATLILANGEKMRQEQARMSKRLVELLGLNAEKLRAEIAAGLVQSAAAAEARAEKAAKVLTRAQRASVRSRSRRARKAEGIAP